MSGFRASVAVLAVLALATMPAFAHGAEALPDDDRAWWTAWNWAQPVVVTNLSVLSAAYLFGLARLWKRCGWGKAVPGRQALAFAAGMASLSLALVSPIDVFSDEWAWMHMIQHMLLVGVAAPLLVLGMPFLVLMWALPLSWRRGYGRVKHCIERWKPGRYFFWQPVVTWLLFALVLWIWHFPPLYEAALSSEVFHDFQHFSFVAVACLFWRVLVDPLSRLKLNRPMGVVYLFLTSLHATLLGVFMTLAPKAWYPFYAAKAARGNLSALKDQQLAGLIMWMPACMVYALVAALLLGLWLRDDSGHSAETARPWEPAD